MVLVPVSAMLLVSAKSPVMLAVTLPSPLTALVILVLTFLLKARVALLLNATEFAVPSVPVAPPLPTCSVPPLTEVVPE